MTRLASLPVRNAISGACIGLLFWLPTILWVIAMKSYDSLWLWLVQLFAIILIGALAGAVGTLPAVHPVASHWRGGLSGFIVAILFGVLIVVTVITPANFPETFLEQPAAQLIVLIILIVGGTLAGAISAITVPGKKSQATGAFEALFLSIVGAATGGGLTSFVAALVLVFIQILQNPPTANSTGALPIGSTLLLLSTIMAVSCAIVSGIIGGIYAIVGAGVSYMGDSALGRSIGATFGTLLGMIIALMIVVFLSGFQ